MIVHLSILKIGFYFITLLSNFPPTFPALPNAIVFATPPASPNAPLTSPFNNFPVPLNPPPTNLPAFAMGVNENAVPNTGTLSIASIVFHIAPPTPLATLPTLLPITFAAPIVFLPKYLPAFLIQPKTLIII